MHGAPRIKSLIDLLCIAEEIGLIDGWKMLGPVVALRRSSSHYFVYAMSAPSFLHKLTAPC